MTAYPFTLTEQDRKAIDAGYVWQHEKAQRVITFIQKFCRHSKGQWAGQPFQLLPWQLDLINRLYGWTKDGLRRYKRCYVSVAKKNGDLPLC